MCMKYSWSASMTEPEQTECKTRLILSRSRQGLIISFTCYHSRQFLLAITLSDNIKMHKYTVTG